MSNLSSVAYLISSILFILSLRGLSHPTTARRGNFYGILGMAIAIITTVSNPGVLSYKEIAIAFIIGGLIGSVIAIRIQMTALPQLVAAFHSLVGLACVATLQMQETCCEQLPRVMSNAQVENPPIKHELQK